MPRKQAHVNADAFLAAYRATANVTEAAKAVNIDRRLHYRWLASAGYKKAFEEAQIEAAQILEDEAVRRAKDGTLEPVFYQGMKCGVIRRYSDGLMQFLLRGFNPRKYGHKTELTGPDGGPVQISIAETIRQRRAERLAKQGKEKDDEVPKETGRD